MNTGQISGEQKPLSEEGIAFSDEIYHMIYNFKTWNDPSDPDESLGL